jgi:hypothetical protein
MVTWLSSNERCFNDVAHHVGKFLQLWIIYTVDHTVDHTADADGN